MKGVLITGANRGLGLALTREALEEGMRVVATCRDPKVARELQQIHSRNQEMLHIEALDVTCRDSITLAAQKCAGFVPFLDLLINNAAIARPPRMESICDVSEEELITMFRVNSVGPIMVLQGFWEQLKKAENAWVVNISSEAGSIATMRPGRGIYSYSASKCALNMLTHAAAFELAPHGVRTLALHPGWVNTIPANKKAPLQPQESAKAIFKVIEGLGPADSGKFLTYRGEGYAW